MPEEPELEEDVAPEAPVDEAGGPPPGPDVDMPPEEGNAQEPYGAQVLRRIHQDHMILLEEYDEMAQLLEHEGVQDHLAEQLARAAEVLDQTEELFEEHYSELEGLEGHGTRPGGEGEEVEAADEAAGEEPPPEAEEADSGPPEEEAEEEAVEGSMGKKGMASLLHNVKAIRARMKGVCPDCGKKGCTCGQKALKRAGRGVPGYEEFQKKPGHRHGDASVPGKPGYEEFQKKPGKAARRGPAGSRKPGYEEFDKKPGKRASSIATAGKKAIDPIAAQDANVHLPNHHKRAVQGASHFLHGVANLPQWDKDLHGPEAYHHARSLADCVEEAVGSLGQKAKLDISAEASPEEIAQGAAMMASMEVPNAKDGGQMVGMPPPPGVAQQPTAPAEGEQKGLHPHYQTIAGAGKFLGELSQVKDFGDLHREKAMAFHKELDPICAATDEVSVSAPEGELELPPPDPMQQMGQKALAFDILRQNEEVKKVAEGFSALASRFGVS